MRSSSKSRGISLPLVGALGSRAEQLEQHVAFQLPNGLTARQNTVVTSVTVPIDATRSAIADFVSSATRPMLAVFDGFSPDSKTIFDIVNILIERRF